MTRFLLWGEKTGEAYRLDTVFFENWYGYQDEGGLDRRLQVFCSLELSRCFSWFIVLGWFSFSFCNTALTEGSENRCSMQVVRCRLGGACLGLRALC